MTFSREGEGGHTSKRLILLTQWFDPEPTFKGLLFARALHDRGYNVEVVTGFPNYPGGRVYEGYRIRSIQREAMDGIAITRLALYPSHDNRALPRIANYLSFCFTAFVYLAFFARRADIVYAYHPPLTVGLAAAMAKLFRWTPTVLDVQDMWPDTLSATGMLNAKLPLRIVGAICGWVYARMSHIIVLSPGFKKLLVERGVPDQKITTIYNWADESAIVKAGAVRPAAMSEDQGFCVLFAGNMGMAQNLDVVLDAAQIVNAANDSIEICFLGGGLETERLKNRAAEMKLPCVRFYPKVPMAEVGSYLMAADCLLVNLRPDPLFEITIPSKTQAYMSAAKPIIMAVAGDAAALIEESKAGITVLPGNASALAAAILTMAGMSSDARAAMAKSAKTYYETHLSLRSGINGFDALFKSIMRKDG